LIRIKIEGDDQDAEAMHLRFLNFKALCSHHCNIQVVLWLQDDLPSDEAINRFWGESIQSVEINSTSFVKNQKGFPVLSLRH
jgi:protein arginine N-methyltransferase 5